MGFFELFGVFVFAYYLLSAFLWLVLDSDIELFIKERFGKPICNFMHFFLIIKSIWICDNIRTIKNIQIVITY